MQLAIPFDNSYVRLPAQFHTRQGAVPVRAPRLLRFNAALAAELGITGGDAATLAQVFSGNETPEGAAPLAQVYAGHQFGGFSPQLGDGRALLLGEVVDRQGRRRDIQLKGSGPTPYSRMGDGRAWLGPVLREYVVSEAMHALGIPTTRALAAVATGEPVRRETGALPGAVLQIGQETAAQSPPLGVGVNHQRVEFPGDGTVHRTEAAPRHHPAVQDEGTAQTGRLQAVRHLLLRRRDGWPGSVSEGAERLVQHLRCLPAAVGVGFVKVHDRRRVAHGSILTGFSAHDCFPRKWLITGRLGHRGRRSRHRRGDECPGRDFRGGRAW